MRRLRVGIGRQKLPHGSMYNLPGKTSARLFFPRPDATSPTPKTYMSWWRPPTSALARASEQALPRQQARGCPPTAGPHQPPGAPAVPVWSTCQARYCRLRAASQRPRRPTTLSEGGASSDRERQAVQEPGGVVVPAAAHISCRMHKRCGPPQASSG